MRDGGTWSPGSSPPGRWRRGPCSPPPATIRTITISPTTRATITSTFAQRGVAPAFAYGSRDGSVMGVFSSLGHQKCREGPWPPPPATSRITTSRATTRTVITRALTHRRALSGSVYGSRDGSAMCLPPSVVPVSCLVRLLLMTVGRRPGHPQVIVSADPLEESGEALLDLP